MRHGIMILLCSALTLTSSPLLIAKHQSAPKKAVQNTIKNKKNQQLHQKSLRSEKRSITKKAVSPKKSRILKHTKQTTRTQKSALKIASTKIVPVSKRQEIVNKAIASARSQAKIQNVSAISSSLYNPSLHSSGVLVLDERSGQVLFEKNARQIVSIASVTKVMTAIVTLDAKLPMNEVLSISEEDIDRLKGTRSRLPVGTKLTRAEMLLLSLMASQNRTASALSRHYPGGQAAFIRAMNDKARQLGMMNTHFYEPTGLDSKNTSTAHDLSLMVSAANRYPEIHQFSTSLQYSFISNITGNELIFRNTNPLTRSHNWNIGLSKTGYISEAGKCLVMHATINEAPVVIVLLDAISHQARINDAQSIKKWMEQG